MHFLFYVNLQTFKHLVYIYLYNNFLNFFVFMFYNKVSTIYYRIVFKIMFNLCKIMFKFIKVFDKHSEYLAEKGNFDLPNVSFCIDDNDVHYNPFDFSMQYLTFVGTETPTSFKFSGSGISYSLDEGKTWVALASNTDSPSIGDGEKIMWKGEMTPNGEDGIGTFSATVDGDIENGTFNIEGNVMSLLYGDNFADKVDLSEKENAFSKLFRNNERIISAKNMKLPATTLADRCYWCMFQRCTSLTTAPELPAKTIANRCYEGMFQVCTSLTTAPSLPATTLADNCYRSMFAACTALTTAPQLPAKTLAAYCYGNMFSACSALTTAPQLPATTLAQSCYVFMFQNCTSLTTAPSLPATTLAAECYGNMFLGCTGLTTAPQLPAKTLAENCYLSMFNGCTELITAPELPATTLAQSCYYSMFQNCTSLTTAPELPATTLANRCYHSMFNGCTSLTTAPELPAETLLNWCYQNMFSGCSSLNYIKAMFTTTPSATYTSNWVSGVAANGTFVKNSAAQWDVSGVNGVPTGWTVQTA